MYGLINQAIKDLVTTKFGDEAWVKICKEARLESTEFVSMQYYPDSMTYGLVGAASRVLKIDASTVLNEFGKYWILYTAQEGYGPLMDLFGSDFRTCLSNLNNLHARMGMSMPNLSPPRFVFAEVEKNRYRLEYHSTRAGLSPMVKGLLEGLAIRYKSDATVDIVESSEPDIAIFEVTVNA